VFIHLYICWPVNESTTYDYIYACVVSVYICESSVHICLWILYICKSYIFANLLYEYICEFSVDIRVYLWILCTHMYVNPIYLWILYICESYTCKYSIRVYFWILCRHTCIFVCMCVCMYTRVHVLRSKWMILNHPLTQDPLPLIEWSSHPFTHLLVNSSWIPRELPMIHLFPLIKWMILSWNDPLIHYSFTREYSLMTRDLLVIRLLVNEWSSVICCIHDPLIRYSSHSFTHLLVNLLVIYSWSIYSGINDLLINDPLIQFMILLLTDPRIHLLIFSCSTRELPVMHLFPLMISSHNDALAKSSSHPFTHLLVSLLVNYSWFIYSWMNLLKDPRINDPLIGWSSHSFTHLLVNLLVNLLVSLLVIRLLVNKSPQ